MIKDELKQIIEKKDILLTYLFGSQARETAFDESDVDIAVLFDEKVNSKDYFQLEGQLIGIFSQIYPQKEINIVNLNDASPLLKQTVVLEGKPLFKKNDLERIGFEVQTLKEYEEFRHFDNIYQQFFNLRLKAI